MPLTYIPKVFLIFKLPDGSRREGFFRQSQRLGDIIASFGLEAELLIKTTEKARKLEKEKTISELDLKNDDTIELL